jgi:eukaryotic-like serine/threonine-protein kinase
LIFQGFVMHPAARMSESQQRYRVVEKLEAGGMAEVYRAESEGLQGFRKQVAIKRVLPHLSEKKKFISMFLDEARLSAQLSHSNCVQVFDIGVGDAAYFIVMEFVDGANLKSIAETLKKQGKGFSIEIAVFIAVEICKGLAYAHEARDSSGAPLNIVHRDMSPPNVLITKYGEIKIVDFGLAKASSQLEKSEPGIIKGKFSYLSPEAAMGQEVDPRTDIFAVGIILWELLTGQRLFLGDTDFQTVKKVQQAEIPSISRFCPQATPELERILNKALAREPANRYTTAREFGQELSYFLFAFGQPVSTFDVASLVMGTLRQKRNVRAPQGSIIDKLIEEALFEFTSLKEDEVPSSEMRAADASGASPLDPHSFIDPTHWAKEIGSLGGTGAHRTHEASVRAALPSSHNEGNLSFLEDPMQATAQPVPAPKSAAQANVQLQNASIQKKSSSLGLIVGLGLLVFVLIVGGAFLFLFKK